MLSWENIVPDVIVYENCNHKMLNFLYKYYSLKDGYYLEYNKSKLYFFHNLLDGRKVIYDTFNNNRYSNLEIDNKTNGVDANKIFTHKFQTLNSQNSDDYKSV